LVRSFLCGRGDKPNTREPYEAGAAFVAPTRLAIRNGAFEYPHFSVGQLAYE
jgi:hypothetical protein